ncbi:MAG: IS66 family transposase [Syntrophobacteraceae bacterium]|jgi:transposase
MTTDALKLPKTIKELEAIIQPYESRIEYLEQRLRVLEKMLFASKSEKRRPDEDEGGQQLHLFNEAEQILEKAEEKPLSIPEHTRQKPKRKPLPPDLPRVDAVHDIEESEKICQCGAQLCRIGEDVCEKLDIIPATVQVIRHIRPKYACKNCEGVESEGPTVIIAPPPPEIIPKGTATPGLLAHVAVSKYADALPLYRQEKIFERYGIELNRSTMAGWMVKAAQACKPVMDLLYQKLRSGPLINVDETPVQVLNEPGRANTTKSYMWVFRGGLPEKPVILYRYSATRSGEIPREVLQGYRGYCQTDAFSGYDGLEGTIEGIQLVGCFVHARRNFIKVVDARGKGGKSKTGSAEVALGYIGQLYRIEKAAREAELSLCEMQRLRIERAEPVLEEFKAWLEKKKDQTPPQGLLGKAISYILSRWSKLVRYLENAYITPDNNAAENAIRPFVIGRKNWLFAGSPSGADAAATIYSLIETAKACGLDPYHYLRLIFEKIPYASTETDYTALLPQSITA